MNRPFSRHIAASALFESAGHREALARLRLMVEHNYLGLLTGEVGSGKSTLIRCLLEGLDSVLYQPVYISTSNLKPKDFMANCSIIWGRFLLTVWLR